MNKIVVITVTLLIFLVGCADKPGEVKVFESITKLQKKYAPDKRVAVFNVRTYERGNALVVAGDVEQQEAKREILLALAAEKKQIIDSINVLPDESIGEKKWGIITVSVANMRSEPGERSELCSQVLMGNIVRILKRKGDWVYVQSPDKYLGWADADQMIRVTESKAREWNGAKKLFATSIFGFVQKEPTLRSLPVCDMTGGALFRNLGTNGEWAKVGLADGRTGYIQRLSIIDDEQWGNALAPAAENIERTGKYLLGVPYLWGGTSTKGVDCSGFTKTVFLLNGLMLQRDASQQAEEGEAIEPGEEFENLKKGDLLFFGKKAAYGRAEKIVHVGIYLGKREYIHSSGKVRINSFDPDSPIYDEAHLNRFVRARRVIASTPKVAEVKTR
jgi:cell wall-associated NlpC family hydrolase